MKNIFRRTQLADAATASIPDDNGNHQSDDLQQEINALQREVDNDPAAKAAQELETFNLTPGSKSLLDRAMDNLAKNTGDGLDDPDARMNAKLRASLIGAAGNNLRVVIAATAETVDKPTDIGPALYSLFYNVVKAAGFIANLDYRRWLDPNADFDMAMYVDRREDEPSAPDGMDTDIDRQLAWFQTMYGSGVEDEGDVIKRAFSDLRDYLQLTLEAFGSDPNRIIPLAMVMKPDGKFDELHDPTVALDHYEIKRVESRKRRNERESARMQKAAERAQAILAKGLA